MALGFTVTNIYARSSPLGGVKPKKVKIVFDASYTTGGYAITAANLGFSNGITTGPQGITVAGATGGFICGWNDATSKLQVYKVGGAGAATECAGNEATLSTDILTCLVWGY